MRPRHPRPSRQSRPPRKVDNVLTEPIVFYCKDCEKIVEVKPFGRKFVYRCSVCGTKNVAFGTEKAIRSFYRFEEGKKEEDKEEVKQQTAAKKEVVEKKPEEESKEVAEASKKVDKDGPNKPIPHEK